MASVKSARARAESPAVLRVQEAAQPQRPHQAGEGVDEGLPLHGAARAAVRPRPAGQPRRLLQAAASSSSAAPPASAAASGRSSSASKRRASAAIGSVALSGAPRPGDRLLKAAGVLAQQRGEAVARRVQGQDRLDGRRGEGLGVLQRRGRAPGRPCRSCRGRGRTCRRCRSRRRGRAAAGR